MRGSQFIFCASEHVVREDAVHGVAEARDAPAAHLLGHHRLVARVAPDAAVLGGDVRAQQPHLARLVPELAVHVVLLAPARVVRHDFVLDETARRVAEHLEFVVHPGGAVVGHGSPLSTVIRVGLA
jgi:hypothetical protein